MSEYSLQNDRFRLLVFVDRRSGVTFEEFERSWREAVGDLDQQVLVSLGVGRYEQMVVDQDQKAKLQSMGAKVPNYDGIILIDGDSLEGLCEYTTKLLERETVETRMLNLETTKYAICHVAPIITTKPASKENGGVRLIAHLKRKLGMNAEEFSKHWVEKHAGVVADYPGVRNVIGLYDQNHMKELVLEELKVHGSTIKREDSWDGVAFLDAGSLEKLFARLVEENFARVRQADEARFLDMNDSEGAPVRVVKRLEPENW